MKIVAVIKASTISRYFPNRYAVSIGGMTLLEFMIQRLRLSKKIDEIVLGTTTDASDDVLEKNARALHVPVYRGPYYDSLERLYGAADMSGAGIIVEINGHYPLVDPHEADRLLERFSDTGSMFAYNEFWNGIVMGMGVELIHRELLDETHRDIRSPLKRRLGSNIYRGMGDRIRILAPEYPFPRPDYRLTLSVPRDRWYINEIIEKSPSLDYAELVRFLDANPLIMRYARQNLDSPQEAGAEKIFVFPDKIQNIQQAGERDADAAYPVSVELTLTNRCNLSCRWCSDSSLRKKTLGDLDFNLVEPLFDDLARHGTRGIVIEGGGEPTIYPRFRDVLEIARERGLSAGLITNGVEMPYEGALDAFEWIRISLDATTSREFLENKGADHFDRVINNIQRLTRHKHRSPLVVGIGFVLTKSNGSRLEELLLNFMKLDVDYIQIRPVIDHPELLPDNLSLDYYKKYSTSDFTIHVHNLSENVIRGNFDVPCRAHSLSSVINANGDVFLCGRLNIYDWIPPVGNLHQNSFHEIWNGEERRRQTAMVFDHDFCRKWCPECRLTKYNILFEKASRIKTRNFI